MKIQGYLLEIKIQSKDFMLWVKHNLSDDLVKISNTALKSQATLAQTFSKGIHVSRK